MLPQREEGPGGRQAVYEERGEEGPDEDLVPDVHPCHEGTLGLLESQNRVQDTNHDVAVIKIVGIEHFLVFFDVNKELFGSKNCF